MLIRWSRQTVNDTFQFQITSVQMGRECQHEGSVAPKKSNEPNAFARRSFAVDTSWTS